jgi:putative endonuclease
VLNENELKAKFEFSNLTPNPFLTAMYRTVHGTAIKNGVINCTKTKMKFYYVYILISKEDGSFYIGFTSNLQERFNKHNKGYVQSTKSRKPWKLVFYEAYRNKYDALRREKYFKTTKGKTTLRSMPKEFLGEV